MIVELLGQNGTTGSRRFLVEKFPVKIGRGPEAAVRLVDPAVADRHCQIERQNGAFVVRDLGTRCGTYVNDQKVDVAEIKSGDKLRVGQSTFVVRVLEDIED